MRLLSSVSRRSRHSPRGRGGAHGAQGGLLHGSLHCGAVAAGRGERKRGQGEEVARVKLFGSSLLPRPGFSPLLSFVSSSSSQIRQWFLPLSPRRLRRRGSRQFPSLERERRCDPSTTTISISSSGGSYRERSEQRLSEEGASPRSPAPILPPRRRRRRRRRLRRLRRLRLPRSLRSPRSSRAAPPTPPTPSPRPSPAASGYSEASGGRRSSPLASSVSRLRRASRRRRPRRGRWRRAARSRRRGRSGEGSACAT